MNERTTCPKCGAAVPPDAPKGLCPACLIRVGAGWNQVDGGTVGAHDAEPSLLGVVCPMIFGGYELLKEIGRGGMGVVYRARHVGLNRPVALKMLLHGRFSDPAFIQRFHTEAEAAAQLEHPHIVPIHDVGQHAGQPYYTMKLVEGESLDQVLSRGPVPPERAARLMITLAVAVSFAHQRGVLHRDIKPHNVLVDDQGEPHLIDFGVAKLLNEQGSVTLSEALIGSPGFMAPEQASGKARHVTTAADVYGLGAVLYALLTARPVFQAETPLETVRQVLEQDPARPRSINPAIDRDLETVCLKCLAKEPGRRYPSAQALADDLARWVRAEPIEARRTGSLERLWLWCRRQPVRAALAGALLVVFGLGLAGVVWQLRRAEAGELFARQNAYAADMNLAQRALAEHDLGQAIALLENHRPQSKSDLDLRRWEWRYLWQLCQDKESALLHRYPSKISAVAVSRDGKLLVLQTGNKVVMWDLPQRRPLDELTNVAWGVLSFSPAEAMLAVGGWDEFGRPLAKVWDIESRQYVASLLHEGELRVLAVSPDGKLLASLGKRGNFRLTDWSTGRILAERELPPLRRGGVGALAFSPDGKQLAVGGDAGALEVLELHAQEWSAIATETGDGVTTLAFSPDGGLLAAGFAFTSTAIQLYDVQSRRPCWQLTNHTDWVVQVAFTPEESLISSGMDRTIRIWSIPGKSELRCLRAAQHGVPHFALLPDGHSLVSGGEDGTVALWDLGVSVRPVAHTNLLIAYGMELEREVGTEGYASRKLDPKVVRRFSVAHLLDGQTFITTDREGFLAVYDAQSVKPRESLSVFGSNNWAVALSPDERWLAVGKASGNIHICDWATRIGIADLPVPFEWFGRLRFSPGGRYLLANVVFNDQSQEFRIWQTNRWQELPLTKAIVKGMYAPALSPDEKLLAMGYTDGTVRLWDFPSGKSVAVLKQHRGRTYDLRFSPDGRLLASAGSDGDVWLWDVGKRRHLGVLRGHSGSVWAAAFSPDGCRIASGGNTLRDAVKVWDVATQRELLCLPVEGKLFLEVSFSPDGNTLQATSFSGLAHFWRAPSWREIQDRETPISP